MIKTALSDDLALVSFELPSNVTADAVSVCGEFNEWSPDAQPLTRLPGGSFRTTIQLPTGRRWQFRYLIDGQRWENDWAADDYLPNDFGTDNSVVDLTTVTLPGPSTEQATTTRKKPRATKRAATKPAAADQTEAPAPAVRARRPRAAAPRT